jgi:hypothetical protein
MLDIPLLVRKNPEIHRVVMNYLLERRDGYISSNCYKRLKKRYERLKSSIDMSNSNAATSGASGNNWMSKITFPLVRENYLLTRAMTKRNFRAQPLITLEPEVGTAFNNAINMQNVLTLNYKSTHFRETAFERIVDSCSRYGAAVSVAQFVHNQTPIKKTQNTTFGPQQMATVTSKKNVFNYPVHILNYAQNPMIAEANSSDWKCIVENTPISALINQYKQNPDLYIKENLEFVIKNAKTSAFHDDNYHHDDKEIRDYNKAGIDKLRFWAQIHINGNEDSTTKYYVEIIGDKIIRIEENPFDEDIDPISVYTMRNRPEYWWGNAWGEDVMPQENFVRIMMNMKAEQAIKALERYIFYAKGAIDTADINNRHVNGGWVPVDVKNFQMQNMIYDYQGKVTDTADTDWLFREIKEQVQKSSPKPDFLRNGNKGGLANNTATAANIIDEMTDLLESDCMEVFSYGLTDMGKKNSILLQQFLGDRLKILPDPKLPEQQLWKTEILGNYWFYVVSSLHKNKVQDAIRLQNVLTQILNFKGSGDPTWQNVNMIPIARKWVSTLDIGDVDEVMPQQQMLGGIMTGQPINSQSSIGVGNGMQQTPPRSPLMQGVPNAA